MIKEVFKEYKIEYFRLFLCVICARGPNRLWGILHSEELPNCVFSANISVIRARIVRWVNIIRPRRHKKYIDSLVLRTEGK